MKVIELENICKDFKVSKKKKFSDYFKFKKKEVVEAVSNVNLCVEKGEFIGLIGLNGAGKSTLIKMMTGILLPTSGEIKVLGNHPFYDRLKNNRKISTVFGQRCKLRWDISPLESMYLIRDMYGVDEKDFEERLNNLTEILKIGSFINQPVRTLSLGQKMKVELAASLLYEPDIIFLDEPTIGLDIITKEAVINFLKTIHGKTTIILTTHDLEDIEELCDRVVIIDDGKIILDDTLGNVIKNSEEVYSYEIVFNSDKTLFNILNQHKIDFEKLNNMKIRVNFKNSLVAKNILKEINEQCFNDIVEIKKVSADLKVSFKNIYGDKYE